MEKRFFIFLGRSGGGKGTQAALLKKYLEEKGYYKIIHTTTGAGFREFIERDSYAAKISKEMTNRGELGPEFLAIWNWANIFINTLTGDETVILDGAPRKPAEAEALHSAITFFGYKAKPIVIYLDVTESTAREHAKKRGREDDGDDGMSRRLGWFETESLPVVDNYSRDPRYELLHVNGDQSIESVHQELVSKLSPLLQV